jgi:hypothetical protein
LMGRWRLDALFCTYALPFYLSGHRTHGRPLPLRPTLGAGAVIFLLYSGEGEAAKSPWKGMPIGQMENLPISVSNLSYWVSKISQVYKKTSFFKIWLHVLFQKWVKFLLGDPRVHPRVKSDVSNFQKSMWTKI